MDKVLRSTRLRRLRVLRENNAPRWIVRSEQVALLLCREGLRFVGIGKSGNARQTELYEKFVIPNMNGAK
jgi:hypothetical protein